jgi:hypothetical protein
VKSTTGYDDTLGGQEEMHAQLNRFLTTMGLLKSRCPHRTAYYTPPFKLRIAQKILVHLRYVLSFPILTLINVRATFI